MNRYYISKKNYVDSGLCLFVIRQYQLLSISKSLLASGPCELVMISFRPPDICMLPVLGMWSDALQSVRSGGHHTVRDIFMLGSKEKSRLHYVRAHVGSKEKSRLHYVVRALN